VTQADWKMASEPDGDQVMGKAQANWSPPGEARVKPMASPFGLVWGRRNRRLGPSRLLYRQRRYRHPTIKRPGRPGYLAIKDLYQKGFGGNWGGVLYTRSCQSASV